MAVAEHKPLGQLLRRAPRYGINAAAVPLAPGLATYIRITDIDDSGRFSPSPKVGVAHASAKNYRLAPGELVFARTGASVGKSYLYDSRDGELVYAGFLINISPDPKLLNPKYLSLFAQSKEYWDWVAKTSIRSGQPGVNGREYAQLLVPLPDIATQDTIAEAMTDVDDAITTLERLIAKKQAIKRGMMQQLLTGKTRLPGFTGELMERRLSDVSVKIQDGTHFSPELGGSDFKYITSRNIGLGLMKLDAVETISEPEHRKIYRRCDTRFGDLLITKDGANTGNAALNPFREEISLLSSVAFVRCDPRKASEAYILQYLLSRRGRQQVKDAMAGNAITRLTLAKIRDLVVPMPEVGEQRALARVLGDADAEIASVRARLRKACDVKGGIMQELLTGRTRLPIKESAA